MGIRAAGARHLVVNKSVTVDDLKRGLEPAFSDNFEEVEEAIMSTGQQLIEKGLRQGRQEGLQEGLQKGLQKGREQGLQKGREQERRELLRQLLNTKFGPLPENAVAKLTTAAADELGRWLTRLLSATTLDEVFEGA